MDLEAHLERREARWAWCRDHLVLGPDTLTSRALAIAWLIAWCARWTLLEPAHGLGWYVATALGTCGAVGVALFRGRAWWALSFVGLVWPYFGLRDWMTQSAVMALIAAVGMLTSHRQDDGESTRKTARSLVIATYFIAVFHKLNSGFLNPEYSCANYGWDKLSRFLDLDLVSATLGLAGAIPWAVLATELAVGVLLWHRPRIGIVLGLLFHIPLTLVLAPAFVFVMALGYVASLTPSDLHALAAQLRRRRVPLLALAGVGVSAGAVLGEPVLVPKVVAMLGGVFAIAALPRHARTDDVPAASASLAPRVAALLFVANALTPYVGTQTQHTGAMLSNLRIDDGCWNHVLVPESIRQVDPYLRIDVARVGPASPRSFARYEEILTTTLWPPSSLALIQRNWCRPHTRPITLAGTYRGRPFEVPDLCAPDATWPQDVGVLGGDAWFSGFLRLQKNLVRECPTACIH